MKLVVTLKRGCSHAEVA